MPEGTLFIYCSGLARDAALAALKPASFTEMHRTFGEFAAALDRLLPAAVRTSKQKRTAASMNDGAGRLALLMQAARAAAPGELGRIADARRVLEAAGK